MLFDTTQFNKNTSPGSAFLTEDNQEFSNEQDFNLFRQEQLQVNRINAQLINERETEINHIVKSINDLNELFKDLATMIVDQVNFLN